MRILVRPLSVRDLLGLPEFPSLNPCPFFPEFMEPFKTPRGEQAALRAATQSSILSPEEVVRASGPRSSSNKNRSKLCRILHTSCMFLFMPLLWLLDCFLYLMGEYVCHFCNRCYQATKRQANLCLNGKKPWMCSVRLTAVNVVVLCSTWYMFSDQVRLAFLPAKSDNALAVVNLVVFCILMVELLFEVFIRPDGYQNLIVSDKAYAPTTVRFINAFHLIVESVSLLCFIPEFYCLFTSSFRCDERMDFSFYNAALIGVTGPTRLDFFYGKAYFALLRFRVFGLVRHWKKMWIKNTFINMRWKGAHGFFSGSTKPQKLKQILPHNHHHHHHTQKARTEASEEAKKKEAVLTNASNIGTALMVTNSYRVLIMLCAIVGLFPALASISASTSINKTAKAMTDQLQAANKLVTNNSNSSCNYMNHTILSWIAGLTPSERRPLVSAKTNTFLLSLAISPNYCMDNSHDVIESTGDTGSSVLVDVCQAANEAYTDGQWFLDDDKKDFMFRHCQTWRDTGGLTNIEDIANVTDLRAGSIIVVESSIVEQEYVVYDENGKEVDRVVTKFSVTAIFNETYAIESA